MKSRLLANGNKFTAALLLNSQVWTSKTWFSHENAKLFYTRFWCDSLIALAVFSVHRKANVRHTHKCWLFCVDSVHNCFVAYAPCHLSKETKTKREKYTKLRLCVWSFIFDFECHKNNITFCPNTGKRLHIRWAVFSISLASSKCRNFFPTFVSLNVTKLCGM